MYIYIYVCVCVFVYGVLFLCSGTVKIISNKLDSLKL